MRLRGDLWAVVSALSTGAGLIAAKTALEELTTLTFNTYLFFIGAIIIMVDASLSGRVAETVRITRAQVLFMLLVAVLFCGGTFSLYWAVALAEPATVSFLSRLELVTTLILAGIFLKERVTLSESAGLILVIAGIIVMRYKASVELSRAVALVSVSALFFGAGEVLIKSRISWINHRALIFYRNVFMTAIFLAAGLVTGQLAWIVDGRMLLILLVAGILLPYLGRLGYLKAMQNISVSRASIITQSQPFFAAVAALVVLGTFPTWRELLGGLLIVAGAVAIKLIEMGLSRNHKRAG